MIRGIRRVFTLPSFRRRFVEHDVRDELGFHLDMRRERLVHEGLAPAAAAAEARRRFGELDRIQTECVDIDQRFTRRSRLEQWGEDMLTDLRMAVRGLNRSRTMAASAVATLTLGIASVTAMFSVVNSVYRPLPYPGADRVVAIGQEAGTSCPCPSEFSAVSLPVLEMLTADSRSFARIALYQPAVRDAVIGGEATRLSITKVDTSFTAVVGVSPEMGRFLDRDEILSDAHVAVISHELWQTLGGDRTVLDQSLRLNDARYRIVGVMPSGFGFPWHEQAWTPLRTRPDSGDTPLETSFEVIAQLRPGVDRPMARQEMHALSQRLGSISPTIAKDSLIVRDEMVDRDRSKRQWAPAKWFLGAALMVWFMVCGNVANLMTVRAAERRTEMAVRASLGAGRWRLARQTLAESLVLAGVAGAIGAYASILGVKLLFSVVPTKGAPLWMRFDLDRRALIFCLGMTIAATVLAGLLPIRIATQFDLATALRAAGAGAARGRAFAITRRIGLVLQLALSVTFFTGTALLARSYWQLSTFDFGFPAGQVASVQLLLDQDRYPASEARLRAASGIAERLAGEPGIIGAGVRQANPSFQTVASAEKSLHDTAASRAGPSDRLVADGKRVASVRVHDITTAAVGDEFFTLTGIKVVAGRPFVAGDVSGSSPVAVVSRRFADRVFGNVNPIGHAIQQGDHGDPFIIVGVAEDTRGVLRDEAAIGPQAMVYLSVRQVLVWTPDILARASGEVATVQRLMKAEIRRVDPEMAAAAPTTLASSADERIFLIRILTAVFGFFTLVALLICAVGIYGVIAYGITLRTREIGLRMALGATPGGVVRFMLREGARFSATGIVIGLAFAAASTRILRSLLFGTSPLDPVVYGGVALLFGAIAMVACYLPSRRAACVDPLAALRAE